MSRSGYVDADEYDYWTWIRYRGAVNSALKGRRGQKALVELVQALDVMPQKKLAANAFGGQLGVCALGALAKARGVDLSDLQPDLGSCPEKAEAWEVDEVNWHELGRRLNIAQSMAREVMYENDDEFDNSEQGQRRRWKRIRDWALAEMTADSRAQFE